MKLRVIQAFGGFATGDEITDQSAITAVLDSEQSAYVVKVPTDTAPDAKKQPAPDAQDKTQADPA
jgi:hypothetical protein